MTASTSPQHVRGASRSATCLITVPKRWLIRRSAWRSRWPEVRTFSTAVSSGVLANGTLTRQLPSFVCVIVTWESSVVDGSARLRHWRAKALGLHVLYFDPYLPDGVDKALGIQRTDSLRDLLAGSHIVSIHCPLTDETRGMIGAREIAMMPRGAFLVNTARGGIVDTFAVVEALASGQLAGAGIDVLEQEPPAADSPILAAWRNPDHPAHDRLLLNPHTAFYCEEGIHELRTKGAREVLRALRGEPLRNVVN